MSAFNTCRRSLSSTGRFLPAALAVTMLGLAAPVHAGEPGRALSQYLRDRWESEKGFPGGRVHYDLTSIQAVLGLVAAGLGVSLLPASVRTLARTGIRFSTLSPSPRSILQLARSESDRSPLTTAFLAAAQGSP